MRIKRVVLKNFLSYKQQTFQFKEGLLLIKGRNGAGKSAILSAIEWALFGKVSRDQKNKELIRYGCKSAVVSIDIDIAGKLLCVDRSVTKAKSGLQVSMDGADITQSTIRETQVKLDTILGFDHTGFCAVALYAQGAASIAALSDAEKKVVLERVLGFERFRKAKQAAQTKLKDQQQALNSVVVDINHKQSLIQVKTTHKENLKKHRVDILQQHKDTLDHLRTELACLKTPVKNIALSTRRQDLLLLLHANKCALEDLYAQRERRDFAVSKRSSSRAELDRLRDAYINLSNQEIKLISDDHRCPTCDQFIRDEDKCAELRKLYLQAVEDRDIGLDDLASRISVLRTEIDNLDSTISDAFSCLSSLPDLERQASEYTEELSQVDSKILAEDNAYSNYLIIKSSLEDQLSNYADRLDTSNLDENIAEIDTHISNLEKEVSLLSVLRSEHQRMIPYLDFWVKAFGRGIQTLIIDTALPYLNKQANLYLSDLTDGAATVAVRAQSETQAGEKRDRITIEASYAHGPGTYGGKSGGEKRRVDLAIQLALGDLVAARYTDVLRWRALDEVLEPLDAEGCEQVVAMLQRRVLPAVGTVLVISHQEEVHEKFDQVMTVTKVNGVSNVR